MHRLLKIPLRNIIFLKMKEFYGFRKNSRFNKIEKKKI